MNAPPTIFQPILAAIPGQPFQLDAPDLALRYTHRKLKDAEVFLFFNESAAPLSHTLTWSNPAHRIESWNAESGTTAPVPAKSVHGKLAVTLELKPYETRILILQ